ALWLLGRPDQAVDRGRQGVPLAGELGQPSSLALALNFAGMLRQFQREPAAAAACAEAVVTLADEHGFAFWRAGGLAVRGWAAAEAGSDGTADNRNCLAIMAPTGSEAYRTDPPAPFAGTPARSGQTHR